MRYAEMLFSKKLHAQIMECQGLAESAVLIFSWEPEFHQKIWKCAESQKLKDF